MIPRSHDLPLKAPQYLLNGINIKNSYPKLARKSPMILTKLWGRNILEKVPFKLFFKKFIPHGPLIIKSPGKSLKNLSK